MLVQHPTADQIGIQTCDKKINPLSCFWCKFSSHGFIKREAWCLKLWTVAVVTLDEGHAESDSSSSDEADLIILLMLALQCMRADRTESSGNWEPKESQRLGFCTGKQHILRNVNVTHIQTSHFICDTHTQSVCINTNTKQFVFL